MGVNFKHLLNKPLGEAKRPEALPAGDYPGIIKSYEQGESSKKRTPYIRFFIGLTGWPDSIDDSQKVTNNKDGSTSPIDLAKKQQKVDFYLTEDSIFMLDEFISSLGLTQPGKTFEDVIPECIGAHVVAQIIQEVDDSREEARTYNKTRKVVGAQ